MITSILLRLKNSKSINFNNITGIYTPNSGNLEANPQIINVNTITTLFNIPGNLILHNEIGKELLKQVFSFPENCKLMKIRNFGLWKQIFII